jgi:hypothetical protein
MQTPKRLASYMDHVQTVNSDAVLPPDAIREPTQLRGRGIFARLSEAAVAVNRDKRKSTATHLSNVKRTIPIRTIGGKRGSGGGNDIKTVYARHVLKREDNSAQLSSYFYIHLLTVKHQCQEIQTR